MSHREAVIKSGWLRREEVIQGSCSTWKKRWNVLSLNKLSWFKHNQSTEPISKCAIAAIERMTFADSEEAGSFIFTLTTSRGTVRLSAYSEEERQEWVNTLRTLIPKAKVALAQEMLMRKAKRKAAHELLHKLMRDAIESILKDSKRVCHLGSYRPYAQGLSMCLLKVDSCISNVAKYVGTGPPATAAADSLRASVDAANSAAAICVNKHVQDTIVSSVTSIAVDCGKALSSSRDAPTDIKAREEMRSAISRVSATIKRLLVLLNQSGDREAELDAAKALVEAAVSGDSSASTKDPLPGASIQERIEHVLEKGDEFGKKLEEIKKEAPKDPSKITVYGNESAQLMCELLTATNIIAVESGYDMDDPDFLEKVSAGPQIPENATEEERAAAIAAYEASLGGISEFKLHQLQNLLAAAKGFAAATTNMVDVMKELPDQNTDEGVLARFDASTHTTDGALAAFMQATKYLDTTDPKLRNLKPEVDPEDQMTAAISNIQSLLVNMPEIPPEDATDNTEKSEAQKETDALRAAARAIADSASSLLGTSAEMQAEIKATRGTGVYVQDKQWTEGLITSANDLGQATVALVNAASNPDTPPEEILALLRSGTLSAAASRLTAFTKAKAMPNKDNEKKLEGANDGIRSATQQMLAATKEKMLRLAEERNRARMSDVPDISSATIKEQQRMEYEQQAKIARLEAKLDEARTYFEKLTKGI